MHDVNQAAALCRGTAEYLLTREEHQLRQLAARMADIATDIAALAVLMGERDTAAPETIGDGYAAVQALMDAETALRKARNGTDHMGHRSWLGHNADLVAALREKMRGRAPAVFRRQLAEPETEPNDDEPQGSMFGGA